MPALPVTLVACRALGAADWMGMMVAFAVIDGTSVDVSPVEVEDFDETHAAFYDQSPTYRTMYDQSCGSADWSEATGGTMTFREAERFARRHGARVRVASREGSPALWAIVYDSADQAGDAIELDATDRLPILHLVMALGY